MIRLSIIIEADTKQELRAGLREARRAGLPVSRSYVRAPSTSTVLPKSEGSEIPAGSTSSLEEKLKPFLSAGDFAFLFTVLAELTEPERRVRLQEQLPGKGKSRLTKFLGHVKTAAEKAGLRYEDILDVRDNELRGAAREVWIGPGPLLRKKELSKEANISAA